jgi:transcriptional regulator with XRE-family HTH domain
METGATFIDRLNLAIAHREGELGVHIRKIDLADAAGVSPSAVTLWYKGKTQDLKAASILGLAAYLKVRVEWLRENSGPMRQGGAALATEPTAAQSFTDGVSDAAKELIGAIIAADRAKELSPDLVSALLTVVRQKTARNKPKATDLMNARLRQRAEALVAKHQPKPRKGKGAA